MAVRLRVKEIAKQKGISMGKLQRDADVAYNTVKRMYKNPYHVITTETLGKLAKALGVTPGELIEEVPDAEAILLGSLFLHPDAAVAIKDTVQLEDFSEGPHRLIY